MTLDEALAAIRPLDAAALAAAQQRQNLLTKPQGSLGQLEAISVQLAGLSGVVPPAVTPWPQEVTAQMVANFLAGGAVVNAIAAQAGASVVVVDVGTVAALPA